MNRAIFVCGIVLTMWTARAADRPATNSCPPAMTLATNAGWELASASYAARQEGDSVIVTATGQARAAGFRVQLAREPVKIFPPKLVLYQKRPEGMAAQVITPFTVCVSFKASQSVGTVLVRDSQGEHCVLVAPPR